MTAADAKPKKPNKALYKSDQDVRWCPGCGDYGILNAVQQVFAELGLDRDRTVLVSGIGCSSRFPYYMETYGMHSIHGRAPAIASGIKLANPELNVWVVTGDGDALSIGGNHFIHMLRRNIGLKVLLFNNRIYGLTKGQYSPTSEHGKVTKSTPFGSVDQPFNPLALAIGAGATFVARAVDVMGKHMREVLKAAAEHEGTAFVEIFQNCNIFNNGAYDPIVKKEVRDDMLVDVRHGEPLVYGKELDKGLVFDSFAVRPVKLGEPDEHGKVWTKEDLPVWNARDPNPALSFAMTQLREGIDPTAIGVIRSFDGRMPYDREVHLQIEEIRKARGDRDLESLIYAGNTWTVS